MYYYYSYLNRIDKGATPVQAAAAAQKMAPAYAYEQLKHMFNEHEMAQLAAKATAAAQGPLAPAPPMPPLAPLPPLPAVKSKAIEGPTLMQSSQKQLGLTLMNTLMAHNGIDLERREWSSDATVLLQSSDLEGVNSKAWEQALTLASAAMQEYGGAPTTIERRPKAGSRAALRGGSLSVGG